MLWILGLLLLLFTVAVPLVAQNSCADPFEGANLAFSTSYWELTDFCQRSVEWDEIRSGGPPPDGIPPLDSPQFETVSSADEWLASQSPVIALVIGGEAKAYPLAILIWHEIANDEIDGIPVAVTYCPLCNSALVFDRRVDGQTLRLGVSGNLRNSDMIMWDDVTQSWWQQFTGEGIVGAYTGTQLTLLPSQIVSFRAFADTYPEGLVLSRDTGASRPYGASPYAGYDSEPVPFLFGGEVDARLPAMEHVLAGVIAGTPTAYPFAVLRDAGVINDVVNELPVVALWQPGTTSALDRTEIDGSRDIGMAALFRRELDGRVLNFAFTADGTIRDDETGSTWNVFGQALDGELAGAQLDPLFAAPHFWFAWAAFRPDTTIYGQVDSP